MVWIWIWISPFNPLILNNNKLIKKYRTINSIINNFVKKYDLAVVHLLFRRCELNLDIIPLQTWLFHSTKVSVLNNRIRKNLFWISSGRFRSFTKCSAHMTEAYSRYGKTRAKYRIIIKCSILGLSKLEQVRFRNPSTLVAVLETCVTYVSNNNELSINTTNHEHLLTERSISNNL